MISVLFRGWAGWSFLELGGRVLFRGQPTCESLAHCHCIGGVNAPSSVVADGGDHVIVSKVGSIVARLIDSCQWNVKSVNNFKSLC